MKRGRWYITIAAIRDYMRIQGTGGPLEYANPDFAAAEQALIEFSETARFVKETKTGAADYRIRTTIRGRPCRLELTVMEDQRTEGAAPQLVGVRTK